MRKIGPIAIAAVVMIGSSLLPAAAAADSAEKKKPCCFTNPRYTGVCKVLPDEEETCSSILAYLNNQQSSGKAYCGNTPIRGGWASVSCEKDEPSTPATSPACTADPVQQEQP